MTSVRQLFSLVGVKLNVSELLVELIELIDCVWDLVVGMWRHPILATGYNNNCTRDKNTCTMNLHSVTNQHCCNKDVRNCFNKVRFMKCRIICYSFRMKCSGQNSHIETITRLCRHVAM